MIYDTGEYNIELSIPTDNFVVYNFFSMHTENINEYIAAFSPHNKQTLIILLGLFQNLEEYTHWIKPLNDYCRRVKNPVAVLNGRLTFAEHEFEEPVFAYKKICMFDAVSRLYLRPWQHTLRKHKYYWASSKDWYMRRYVLAGLIKNDLLKDNLVNYKCVTSHIPSDYLKNRYDNSITDIIVQEAESISNLVPLPELDNTVEFMQTDVEFYTSSYLGIITDTFFESGVFLSEKIFNAMNYGQIFFYIGPANTLQYLRNQGYKTFDNIIDTSYDSIKNNGQRLIAARNSLIKFLSQPIEQIQAAYEQSRDQIEHNMQQAKKQNPQLEITQFLHETLNEYRTPCTNIS